MKYVNLCPHRIDIVCNDGQLITLPPSGEIARVSESRLTIGVLDGVEFWASKAGPVVGLPEPIPGIIYVASGFVAAAAHATGRYDVASPGEILRNADGQPVGCKGLKVHPDIMDIV